MTERKYLQLNLDTDTLPTSSVMHDVAGNTLAKLDLNLSSNLIGNLAGGKLPKKVEFKVTKLSVPLSGVPFTYIPFRSLSSVQGIISKAVYTVLPYTLNDVGQLVVSDNPLFNHTMFARPDALAPQYLIFPYNIDSPSLQAFKEEIVKTGEFPVPSIYDILKSLNDAHKNIMSAAVPVGFSRLEYTIENERFKILTFSRTENQGLGPLPMSPFYDRLELVVYPSGNVSSTVAFYPHLQSVANVTMTSGELNWDYTKVHHPYCIGGNRYLRDMLPTLPWIRVDTRSQDLPFIWPDYADGDPYIYILDTRKTSIAINKSVNPYEFAMGGMSARKGVTDNYSELVLSFEDVNPISFSSVTSFVLMTNGLDATQQIFPVNITGNSDASTQIPVLEVYFPLWKTISDQSDRIIVDKEQFTNQPLFVTNNYSSICERNITFQLYNVRSGGKLSPLVIRPGTRFCLQITFALYY